MADEDEEWEYDSADEYDDGAPRAAAASVLCVRRRPAPLCDPARLPEREAAGGKDTGAAGPVVRSMSWDGTALKHTVWPVHPSGWKRPADYPIKGE